MNKTFAMKNGMIVDLSLGQTGDARKGTLLLSKLLHANQFMDLDGSDDEDEDSQMQTINHADNAQMKVTMALTDENI